MNIKILLADDHKIMRDGLRSLIEREPDMEVVGEAETGRRTIQLIEKLKPDMVIMDITMPDMNGIEATHQIRASYPEVKVIALSMHSDRRLVAEMLKAGAASYLLKDCAFAELVRAIKLVIEGGMYLGPGITGVVVDDYVRHLRKPLSTTSVPLTARESEVLKLLAEGKHTKEIACFLQLSIKTIETHKRNIMDKLRMNSVAEITKYAIREGLTTL